jgi:hypothetical protein
MPKFDKYYVVEYRFPIMIEQTETPIEAVSKASRMCERMFGFKPDNWYARVFEYTTGEKVTGPVKEYFYNPNSSSVREIEKNIGYFNDMIEKGINPDDLMSPEKAAKKIERNNDGVAKKAKKTRKEME